MAVKSIGRYVRVSPRKARLVIDMIRGRYVQEALDILRDSPRPWRKRLKNSCE